MQLSTVQQKFILHWGEMGTRWGINRTVAQIHALLYVNPEPLHAEQITETLSVARSNVSTSLRELQGWRIVKIVHVLGDRRDHFETGKDVWELFRIILEERKRREIDPTITLLRECVRESSSGKDRYTSERIKQMLDFLEATSTWYHQLSRLPTAALVRFVKLGGKVPKLLGLK